MRETERQTPRLREEKKERRSHRARICCCFFLLLGVLDGEVDGLGVWREEEVDVVDAPVEWESHGSGVGDFSLQDAAVTQRRQTVQVLGSDGLVHLRRHRKIEKWDSNATAVTYVK